MNDNNLLKLRNYINDHCIIVDNTITLSSGISSNYYIDCKKAMLDGECLNIISDCFLSKIYELDYIPNAIGGLTIGADFITAAILIKSYQSNGLPILGSIVRKNRKKHGMNTIIENVLSPGTKIVLIDDVITTGNSILFAGNEFKKLNYDIIGVVCLIDREENGIEKVSNSFNCPVSSIFRKRDFSKLY
jgi:orotate phosphoribosyltransferase